MLGTRAANRRQLLRHCLPRPVQSYRSVVRRCLLRLSEGFDRGAAKVNLFNRGAILALQVADHVTDTGACCLGQFWLVADRCFGGKRLTGSCLRSSSPIVVCRRISKDAIKPCDCALFVTDFRTVFHSFQVCRLEDVLGSPPCLQRGQTESSETLTGDLQYVPIVRKDGRYWS